jgi:hypothetical protein
VACVAIFDEYGTNALLEKLNLLGAGLGCPEAWSSDPDQSPDGKCRQTSLADRGHQFLQAKPAGGKAQQAFAETGAKWWLGSGGTAGGLSVAGPENIWKYLEISGNTRKYLPTKANWMYTFHQARMDFWFKPLRL